MPSPDSGKLIAALQRTFGEHRGRRPAHANGVALAGSFTAHPDAARVCRAAHLQGAPVPVRARLSNGSGQPGAPDWVRDRRGLATRFALADGTCTDLVCISHPVYFAREPQDLVDFSRMRLRDYLAAHPYAARAITIAQTSPLPASYATVAYHAVHAFRLLDSGATAAGRAGPGGRSPGATRCPSRWRASAAPPTCTTSSPSASPRACCASSSRSSWRATATRCCAPAAARTGCPAGGGSRSGPDRMMPGPRSGEVVTKR